MRGPSVMPGAWDHRLAHSYDRVAERYAAKRIGSVERNPLEREILDRYAQEIRGQGQVCDIGCGPGVIAAYLYERGVDVFGVDISPRMIQVAQQQHPALEFRVGDQRSLDVPSASLAGIVSLYSILHLPRPLVPQALAEMARVIRPEGQALFALYEGVGKQHDDVMLDQPVSIDTCFFQRGRIKRLIEAAGFEILSTVTHAPVPSEFPMPSIYVRATLTAQ